MEASPRRDAGNLKTGPGLRAGPSWDWLREKTLDLVLKELGRADVRELEREAFRMAAGGEHGCSLAKNEKLQSQLRQLWKDWLEAQDLGEKDLLHQAEGQPLYLRPSSRGRATARHPGAATAHSACF